MAKTKEDVQKGQAVYQLQGTLLEACSCGILCPCWVGEDPDNEACWAFNAYHLDSGQINGIDVAGLNFIRVVQIPGNVLTPKSWRQVILVDEDATPQQEAAILSAFAGELGGPLADVAGLIGETVAVEHVKIRHEVTDGAGKLVVDGVIESEMEPYRGPDETVTTLRDSLFSTVPGSPAWVGKASVHKVTLPQHGMEWSYEGRNAIQADFRVEFAG